MSASITVESILHRPRPKPLLPRRLDDQRARQLAHRLRAEPARELADRRLVRHPLRQRDPAEPPQMDRVRDLRHQRPIPPAVALLEHHQPHIGLHRDRRPPIRQHRPPGLARPRAANAPRSAPAAPDRPATDPAPPDPPAAPAPRPATPRPTTTPPAPPRASAHALLLDQKPVHLQGILTVRPDGTAPQTRTYSAGSS